MTPARSPPTPKCGAMRPISVVSSISHFRAPSPSLRNVNIIVENNDPIESGERELRLTNSKTLAAYPPPSLARQATHPVSLPVAVTDFEERNSMWLLPLPPLPPLHAGTLECNPTQVRPTPASLFRQWCDSNRRFHGGGGDE